MTEWKAAPVTSLSKTIAQLAAMKGAMPTSRTTATRLTEVPAPSPNPGALRGWSHLPAGLAPGAPLVVVLHGCTQTAAGYDAGTGWSTLADEQGFALLFPEQVRGNNANLCFNWFEPADIGRTGGEAESIARMTTAMIAAHHLDPARVFVTGLSAGGAMTAVMLAAYPELFAGGAIIGGLPYGSASTVSEALTRMRGQGGADDAGLASAVRHGSFQHRGRWPSVSIWHGSADATVAAANMDGLGRQWRGVHGVEASVPAVEAGPNWTHSVWRDADGRDVVEEWSVTGMGHGVPIDPSGPARLGQAGAYMLDVGLSSTAAIAHSWGLMTKRQDAAEEAATPRLAPVPPAAPRQAGPAKQGWTMPPPPPGRASAVQDTIEAALRSAGLMR
ncbi:MAG TPA: PHB depolymerase family esterase [Sphingomonas sp.]|jgi:poly(hydroxyalkanoate) depolymerase family esterase|uniref:extracellular catalytic domain type 1 short-chain-length polyhydroxyalkanoate depolymerase n=1 Tax=Sphingomonas sp. TaxID=28214 RepID=UPI002EDA21DD